MSTVTILIFDALGAAFEKFATLTAEVIRQKQNMTPILSADCGHLALTAAPRDAGEEVSQTDAASTQSEPQRQNGRVDAAPLDYG